MALRPGGVFSTACRHRRTMHRGPMPPWTLYAIAAALFAGLTSVVAKRGMENIPADLALALRTGVVLLLVWLNAAAMGVWKSLPALTGRAATWLALSGLTTALSWICYYRAMKTGPVSYIATIDKGSILLTLLLSCLWLGEPFTWKLGLGAALVGSGLVVLAWK